MRLGCFLKTLICPSVQAETVRSPDGERAAARQTQGRTENAYMPEGEAMKDYSSQIIGEVSAWPAVCEAPHRFGGVEFNLGTTEIGHYHRFGMLDILFTKRIREALTAEGLAQRHHLLPETGWISYYTRRADDADHAIWLLRLAYLHHVAKAQRRPNTDPEIASLDVASALNELNLSDALCAEFARVIPALA